MAIVRGMRSSWEHDQNGMTWNDMQATRRAADKLGEVIIFRSTGSWSLRWLERDYPSKNFHVKGKSSDWGPQAGFVPFDGFFSKVGYDKDKALKGTGANIHGLESKFAAKVPLCLTESELHMQLTRISGGRTALSRKVPIEKSHDLILYAKMSGAGDGRELPFRAMKMLDGRFEIRAFSPLLRLDLDDVKRMVGAPLEVMSSNEKGADNKAMTGDYDLLSVCPSWADYGSLSSRVIRKDGIHLEGGEALPDFVFPPGISMDSVLDPSLHTAGTTKTNYDAMRNSDDRYRMRQMALLGGKEGPLLPRRDLPPPVPESDIQTQVDENGRKFNTPLSLGRKEHADMGNLTPRILRAINELNREMGAVGDKAPFRRVHHNAESHRNARFGALTKKDMLTKKDGELYGDGFPLTVFQPNVLLKDGVPTSVFTETCTLEDFNDFQAYTNALKAAGFYVPRNWSWEMTEAVKASDEVASHFAKRAGK